MIVENIDLGRIVLYQPSPGILLSVQRRADRYGMEVESATSAGELCKKLISVTRGILVLCGFDADAQNAAKSVRAQKGWKRLPIFAMVADIDIDTRMMKKANTMQVELLPSSVPENRRWQMLREAHQAICTGRRRTICNRRAHFRLPLRANATLLFEIETIDISMGGVAFYTNQEFHIGDFGRIDVRSLLGDMDETDRGFPFEVVAVKHAKHESFKYMIGARFAGISEDKMRRLSSALEVIEPTHED